MLDQNSAALKKIELRAAHARRTLVLVSGLEDTLEKENEQLRIQVARVHEHVDREELGE